MDIQSRPRHRSGHGRTSSIIWGQPEPFSGQTSPREERPATSPDSQPKTQGDRYIGSRGLMLKRVLLPIVASAVAFGAAAGPAAAQNSQAPKCPPGVANGIYCVVTPTGILKFPAKLQVFRATVTDRKLDVLASLTARASGKVKVTYDSNRTITKFTVNIDPKTRNLKFTIRLSKKATKLRTGILTLIYDGNARTFPDAVRVRAANRPARLKREVAKLDNAGNLTVSGTVSKLARGVVRIRLDYPFSSTDGTTSLFFNPVIKNGKWSLKRKLPADAAAVGGQLSIQFTGYYPRLMRGEQDAKQVLPGGS